MPNTDYKSLLATIGQTFTVAREQAYSFVSHLLLEAYWKIGKQIIEYEQKGQEEAIYRKKLIEYLSKDLSLTLGKGFSRTNLYQMRQFYEAYPIFQTSGKLTWSHYAELLSISDPLARSFYEKQSIAENWSVRQLKRQVRR